MRLSAQQPTALQIPEHRPAVLADAGQNCRTLAAREPVGSEPVHLARVPGQRAARRSADRIPELDETAVPATGEDRCPVRPQRCGQCPNPAAGEQLADRLAGGGLPDRDATSGGDGEQ
jgi:hypothetical protein